MLDNFSSSYPTSIPSQSPPQPTPLPLLYSPTKQTLLVPPRIPISPIKRTNWESFLLFHQRHTLLLNANPVPDRRCTLPIPHTTNARRPKALLLRNPTLATVRLPSILRSMTNATNTILHTILRLLSIPTANPAPTPRETPSLTRQIRWRSWPWCRRSTRVPSRLCSPSRPIRRTRSTPRTCSTTTPWVSPRPPRTTRRRRRPIGALTGPSATRVEPASWAWTTWATPVSWTPWSRPCPTCPPSPPTSPSVRPLYTHADPRAAPWWTPTTPGGRRRSPSGPWRSPCAPSSSRSGTPSCAKTRPRMPIWYRAFWPCRACPSVRTACCGRFGKWVRCSMASTSTMRMRRWRPCWMRYTIRLR